MFKKVVSLSTIIVLWWLIALSINRTVILPMPQDVFIKMIELATTNTFYSSIYHTLLRVLIGFGIAAIIGIILGMFSGLYKSFEDLLYVPLTIIQAIPQIAYILILLVWFEGFLAIIIIIGMMVFPVFYNNISQGIKSINRDLKDVIWLYNQPFLYTVRKIYLPLVIRPILSSINTCLPLSFKVGIMAEIFIASTSGIGSAIYLARINIDMISIFAWVGWMIIIIILVSKISQYIESRVKY